MAARNIFWSQWLACIIAGLSNGWTSPFLAKLTIPNIETSFKLTESEASWVASLVNLGRFFGVIIGAILQGIVGRKNTILMATLPITIGWSSMIFSNSVLWLYSARIFCGIGSGITWSAISLYISEIADSSIRGSLILLTTNTASFGALLGNIIGPYLKLEEFGYVVLTIIIIFIILFSFIPDSPYYYILMNNEKKAEQSLKWYKPNAIISKEINEIKLFIGNDNLNLKEKLMEFNKPNNRKNIISLLILNIFLLLSGHNIMSYYAEIIVIKSKINIKPSNVVILLGFCTVIAGITATFVIDKFGRRFLLISSSIGTCLSMIILSLHFHLLSLNYHPNNLIALPIIGLLLFNFSISLGMIPVPGALLGELFEHNTKTYASMFFSGSLSILSFLTTKTFQPVLNIIGEKYIFLLFSFGAFFTAPFTYFFINETKGKTLVDIQKNSQTLSIDKKGVNTISS
ncbi:hypothetical protein HCN44_011241 [Aphidius gifuensis]|uniref:Major facilitator superfamily (MFS) profile domain-containing protein n=1 Tax=Aphidius gifuensis TaxID=684658 RepID=A0A834XWQ2_APHGI|nr:hypothetical protein HCN44_011241 [Aphidius gifuensis]